MGDIKSYTDLNENEKNNLYKFMKEIDKDVNSESKLNEIFKSKIYDYGKGAIFFIKDEQFIAKACVVLEVAKELKSSYIHKIHIEEIIENKSFILEELIKEAIDLSKLYGADNIRLGLSQELISEAKKIGIEVEYRSLEMSLEDTDKRYELLDLKELSNDNKEKYVEIYSDSFRFMPHGTITDIETVNKLITDKDISKNKNEYYYIVSSENDDIGFMEIYIDGNKGQFDIGLCEKYRKQGYGNRLLETAIQFLKTKGIENISLILIEQNKIAYNMYKKRGFKEVKTIGWWSSL